MKSITAIILTYNEQLHIERCIRSLQPFVQNIFVVDCHSTDDTCEIARSLGARVFENDWVNYATQFNWAIDHCPIDTDWIFRIDADEYVTEPLAQSIISQLDQLPADVTGLSVRRRVIFIGRWLRHGSIYPINLLRLWRTGKGRCENRWMDEHIKLIDGRIVSLQADIVDENLNNLSWWIDKHNKYATREALDVLISRHLISDDPGQIDEHLRHSNSHAVRQRWLKKNIYYRMPVFVRTWLYYIYRFVLRLGFLDGYSGMVFHMMQALWYRTLVDAKVREMERCMAAEHLDLRQAVESKWGIKI